MATRLFVTSRALGTRLLGPPLGAWSGGDSGRDNRGDNHWTFLLAQAKPDGGVIGGYVIGAGETATANQKIILYRWVTDPMLADFTLGGTLDLCLRGFNAGQPAAQLVSWHVHAYVTQGDSLLLRQTILDNYTDALDWADFTVMWRSLVAAQALSGSGLAGDRLCVEIGVSATPPTAPVGDTALQIGWGTTNSSHVVQADATNGSTTTLMAAWVEFSDTLSFAAAVAPPANDACADAVVISSLPYVSPRIDTTESTDTDRAVWYTFTAAVTQRMFFTCWGSNYGTRVRVRTGTCASSSIIRNDAFIAWIGRGQTLGYIDATAGVSYLIQVTSHFAVTGDDARVSARNSGGSLVLHIFTNVPLDDDDLYVDCQHIVGYRAGVPFVASSLLYELTPTGNAIDYSLRPLDDQNGGVDASLRLYVGAFGPSPTIYILDLATLNETLGEVEIDFLNAPIDDGNENISTVLMDRSGNLIMGWYGNAYSVFGALSSPLACRVRKIDGTHADNQAGAPWPAALAYTVQQQNSGSDFTELAVDQDTLWYTSAGDTIYRYSLGSGQLSPFATVALPAGPRPGLRSVRLITPGDGSQGALVAAGSQVLRLNASGVVIQTYTPSPASQALDLDKIEFTKDGLKFWVSDQFTCYLFQFDIQSGAQLATIDTQLPVGQLSGFSIYHGFRSTNTVPPGGGGFGPPTPPTPPGPPGPPAPPTTSACPPQAWLRPAASGCVAVGELPDNGG